MIYLVRASGAEKTLKLDATREINGFLCRGAFLSHAGRFVGDESKMRANHRNILRKGSKSFKLAAARG